MEDEDTNMQDSEPSVEGRSLKFERDLVPDVESSADGSETEPSVEESLKFERDLIPDVESRADSSEMFDHESARMALAKMFILDELPFKVVEHEGFKTFMMSAIKSEFQLSSRITLIKDCYQVYIDEKFKLKEFLSNVDSRICLSMNTWTSIQNISYVCLTAHFIDVDWKLHRKILNLSPIPNEKGEEIGRLVESCVVCWGIKNVGTVTVENSGSNDVAMLYLKHKLHRKDNLLFGGEFFHIKCSANILNLIVRDCLDEMQTSVARIRDAVKYVRSSTRGAENFKLCIIKEGITCSRSICLDVKTRWNSTYFMLDSALNFQKAFQSLEEDDPEFVNALTDGAPTICDWDKARALLKFLEVFYYSSMQLSGSHVTSSLYLHHVSFIQAKADEWAKSSEACLQNMALKMKEKFTKYWGSIDEINLLLLISMALDPCFKVKGLRVALTKAYPSEAEKVDGLINRVTDTMKRLFDHYKKIEPTSLHVSSKAQDTLKMDVDESIGDGRPRPAKSTLRLEFKRYMEEKRKAQRELELELYLEDGCEPIEEDEDFDILSWWKRNSNTYRVLSKIAKDVLSIPVSTLDSQSACSFGDPVLGEFHSSLPPMIVESLVCAKNWLRTSPPLPNEVEEDLEEMEKLQTLTLAIILSNSSKLNVPILD